MRLIVGVTGASGVVMSRCLLEGLREAGCEVDLIVSAGAKRTWELECGEPIESLLSLAHRVYDEYDLSADIASGSCLTDGMILLPCSMKTLAGIVSGYSENLILRCADVCLKEGRKLILVPRETPLSRIHLRNLKEAADCGCTILPPMLSFYTGDDTVEGQIRHLVGKLLLQFRLPYAPFQPWKGGE